MAYSTQRATSDGTMVLLDISVDYLDRSEITVYFDDVLTSAWMWSGTSDKRILFPDPVPNGVEVLIKRTTDASTLRHKFSQGAKFTSVNLDEDLTQALHMAQEASEANLVGDFFTDVNLHGFRLFNVGPAVDDTDALTLGQYKADALGANAARVAAEAAAAAATSAAAGVTTLRNDLLSTSDGAKGPALVGFNPTLNYAVSTLGRHVAQDLWNCADFPWNCDMTGSTSSKAAFQACVNAAAAAGAGVYIPPGVLLIYDVSLPANTYIQGAGKGKTTVWQDGNQPSIWFTADPGSANTYTENITIRDLTMRGNVDTLAFSEVRHIMFTQGVSDLLIERCHFIGFRGDGLYIGTGNERGQNPTQERHNRRIIVRSCFFDGLVKDNRNGISVVEGNGVWIQDNTFTRIGRSDMPGAIDIEPDSGGTPNGVLGVIQNIHVTDNKFYDIDGQGAICVNLINRQTVMSKPVTGIRISGNFIDGGNLAYTCGIALGSATTTSPTDFMHNVVVSNNYVRNVQVPFRIEGYNNVTLIGNFFGESQVGASITDSANTKTSVAIRLLHNVFYKVGQSTVGGTALYCYGTSTLKIVDNLFHTIGRADNAANYAIDFVGTGAQTDITVTDNEFYHPTANANAFDVRNDGGTLSVTTFRYARNKLTNYNGGKVVFNNVIDTLDWRNLPASGTGWGAAAGKQAPQYAKDSTGRVWLRGAISGGTIASGTVITTLPVGFRPSGSLSFVVWQNAGTPSAGFVTVDAAGTLQTANITTNVQVSLDGLSWAADQ